jgi:hypothetical protein
MTSPKKRGGVAVPGNVRIPINFNMGGGSGYVSKEQIVTDPPWAKTASAEQVRAAYPARAADLPVGQAVYAARSIATAACRAA